ncbi:DUF4124 domain-containing protein [Pseudocolwellia sp. HL-MZ7]|uniref:DUF4124 domain-containing protein n=1 Tax=Pseudocolwellia sp. HL-MZ7 TaxID=3400627 RepID=UPI003CE7DC13
MKWITYLGIFIVLAVLSEPATSEIYKWVDENGKVHFSDKPPATDNVETLDEQELADRTSSYTNVSIDSAVNLSSELVIYTTTSCRFCEKAKRYFDENQIAYLEKNIDKSKVYKREFEQRGGKGVPTILWKDKVMRGFSVTGFEKTYLAGSE